MPRAPHRSVCVPQVGGSQASVVSTADRRLMTTDLAELGQRPDQELIELFREQPPLKAPHGILQDGQGAEAAYMLFRSEEGVLRDPVLLYEAQGCVRGPFPSNPFLLPPPLPIRVSASHNVTWCPSSLRQRDIRWSVSTLAPPGTFKHDQVTVPSTLDKRWW